MEKYETLGVVGEGSYGLVLKCRHRESGQLVAIKRFLETEDDLAVRKMALREIRMLKKLRHENLVSMLEVFRRKRRFYLVFEFMDHTLLEELEERTSTSCPGLGEATVRRHAFQILRGLDFCHSSNIIHRDVKPENVLVSKLGVVKLCDFGFARMVAAPGETYTDYVATRWYRAPELLVGDTLYGKEVDVWAVGCLMAEMMTGNPLFAGDSDIDQLFLITKALGKLSNKHQHLISRNPMFKGMRIGSAVTPANLYDMFPSWPRLSLDFTSACLRLDPNSRPPTSELLQHTYFNHDGFPGAFLPELRARMQQECQNNPLLSRRFSNTANSARSVRGDGAPHPNPQSDLESLMLPAALSNRGQTDRDGSGPRWNKVQEAPERRENLRSRRGGKEEQEGKAGSPTTRTSSRLQRSLQQELADLMPPSPAGHDVHASGSHLYVLHPSINNLSFGNINSRFSDTSFNKRSPLGNVTTGTNATSRHKAPPLVPAAGTNKTKRIGSILGDSVDRPLESPPPATLTWGRRLAPLRHRGLLPTDEFSLPNLPGAVGSPNKMLKKREKLGNLVNIENYVPSTTDKLSSKSNLTDKDLS
ncbi:cyclin-dependent kinase-like 2 [Neocloeon triangulifer]|uniref:cyclin-dependent kinase-like 2 n=1 Tax=Neocloeon triangulifer TaxID=2078957 RepID=UPI00286FA99E|nr:cyclin-dependent kinase-like 2 [Neocloeon triangulifer]